MPKLTLQQRLVDALVATGRGTPATSRSRKYVTLKRPDGTFCWVQPPPRTLRFGKSVSDTMAAPEDFNIGVFEEAGR